ncbi:hypothetical protein ACI8AF_09150 [Blastococcus sp. SYSU D00669]
MSLSTPPPRTSTHRTVRLTRNRVRDDGAPATAPPPPEVHPTGPVDGLPRPPRPTSAVPLVRPRRGTAAVRVLVLGSAGLLQTGLLLRPDGEAPLWSAAPLWAAFATLAVLLSLLAAVRSRQLRNDRAWNTAAAGLTALAVFWVLVVLPEATTNRGFVLTAALGCLGVALWLAPARRP